MSYLLFHVLFILPPLALLALEASRRPQRVHSRSGVFLTAMTAIALVYTTPWDNYLVWRGVWAYGEGRILGTIGYVPVEEYLFFVLQPLLTGLWLYRLVAARGNEAPAHASTPARWAGALVYAAAAAAGMALLRVEAGTYLGLILAWAAPVLALQWAYAGGEIWRRRQLFALAVAAPTLYLWAADAVAIHLGVWRISERYTLGLALGPLPLEEAVFFLVTNLLIVQGLILFLFPPGRQRLITPAGIAAASR